MSDVCGTPYPERTTSGWFHHLWKAYKFLAPLLLEHLMSGRWHLAIYPLPLCEQVVVITKQRLRVIQIASPHTPRDEGTIAM